MYHVNILKQILAMLFNILAPILEFSPFKIKMIREVKWGQVLFMGHVND